MRFHKIYFLLFLLLLVTEVLIALYVRDTLIRPYGGDFLVVIMVYCFLRALLKITVIRAAIVTLLFAYLVEFAQLAGMLEWLGLEENRLAKVVLGSSFEWGDLVAYTMGIIFVLIIERLYNKLVSSSQNE
ncbi:MAG: DUF2809 domain-containing protein [Cyclobacteriaceae bacterium]